MKSFKGSILFGGITLLLLLIWLAATQAEPETTTPTGVESLGAKKRVVIAIVKDGPSRLTDQLIVKFREEISKLLSEEKEIVFKEEGFDAGWDPEAISTILQKTLDDPEIDMIFAAGVLITQAAASPDLPLRKPVVAGLIQRLEVLNLPFSESGKSKKDNLAFACVNLSVEQDIKTFHEMIGFQRLTLIVDDLAVKKIEDIQSRVKSLEESLRIGIDLITGGTMAEEVLSRLGSGQAVLLTAMPRMSAEEHRKLIEGINERRLPSFSLFGYPDVEAGVLAGLTPSLLERAARRSALDVQQILQGFSPSDLRVLMSVESQLLINAKTARKIGYSPSFLILRTANILHGDLLQRGKALTLDEAIRMAGKNNINLAISQANVELSKQDSLIRRSLLLPQAESGIEYNQIDSDTAAASQGMLPETRTAANLDFSQVVFDDSLIAGYRSARKSFEAAQFGHESVRLDAMQTGGRRFSELLAALSLFRIETENLRLTQNNLSMARLKFDVGMSGLDEVYRWEAQEASQRGNVFTRWSVVQQNLVALNQSLNIKQDTEWTPVDLATDQIEKYLFRGKLSGVLNNVRRYEQIQGFLVEFALENDPSLAGFEKEVEGQTISLNQKKRQFYLPRLDTKFSYVNELQASRPGGGGSLTRDDQFWVFGTRASLPILEGGKRIHEVDQSKANLLRLNEEQMRTAQLLEQQMRSALYAAVSSRESIFYTREAADKAKLNLKIVQDKYAEGTIGILSLLDAQNEYIQREQTAALAVYRHLADLIDIQRSLSWFMVDKTEEEKNQWYQEMKMFLEAKN